MTAQELKKTILMKYSDDTAIVDLSNSITNYMAKVETFTRWFKDVALCLNVIKTKELLFDLRWKIPPAVPHVKTDGEIVERIDK